MKRIIILSLIIFSNCSKEKPTPINNDEVIISANSVSYSELTDVEKSILKQKRYSENFCCYPNNWNSPENCEVIDSAFFVRVKLHARLLALLTESKTFDFNYLLSDNTNTLYGKYKNRWELLNKNEISICKTEKFDGFENVYIFRNNNVDNILLGPINEKPYKLKIKISNSKNYPDAEPEILIE
ncbi:hypothetical protein [Empedobacter falsenii]